MRLLIDGTQLTRQKAGVGVYGLNLLRELAASAPKLNDTIVVLVQDDDPDFEQLAPALQLIKVPSRIFRHLPLRLLLEQVYLPWLCHRLQIDVLHSLHYSFPLCPTRARKMVTVHDLTSVLMPNVHSRTKLVYFRSFLRACTRFADGLIFVSASTQADWRRLFPASRAHEFVIPLGKSREYRGDLPAAAIATVLHRHRIAGPYLLYIGTIEPRKNLTRLVLAFSRICDRFPQHTLVIAGNRGWMYDDLFRTVANLNLEERVRFTGFIPEEDKRYLIAGADVFVYPSLYEGFGIPVLEAMACGTPTLTSNNSSLREVAGDGAMLVDPEDTDAIALGVARLLDDDPLRRELRTRSLAQASLFSWDGMARETRTAYAALVNRPEEQPPTQAGPGRGD